jgi:uncharacterized protein YndB with AHSA1/START domain
MSVEQPEGSRTSRVVRAGPEEVYAAFMDRDALLSWLPPAEMTGEIHEFDPRVGGGYVMSLFYPADEKVFRGKTGEREDRVRVRFEELEPARRIVEAVTFESGDPAFHGEMRIVITFHAVPGGTEVAFTSSNLPPGLRAEDNDTGTRLSLAQLARRFE